MNTALTEGGGRSPAELRKALDPYCRKRNAYALTLLAIDVAMFGVGQMLAVAAQHSGLRLAGTILTWTAIVRLFVIGHDACHQAFTSNRLLNQVVGRIAFVVSLTPYSLWRAGHNVGHHGFNNLRGRDFVWEPKQPDEYLSLPRWRRWVERVYRSAWGPGIYYFVEIWWKRLFFPRARDMPAQRLEFSIDSAIAGATVIAWACFIAWYAGTHHRSIAGAVLLGFVVPFVLWIWSVGLVVYLHHTDPQVRWFANKKDWLQSGAQISSTVHVMAPAALSAWMHHIMEHPAHHLNAAIPLYNLKAAQRHLHQIGPLFRRTPLTLGHYLRCVGTCKLFDYEAQSWVPFPRT